jgi:uncharacterized protein (DUF58 family)
VATDLPKETVKYDPRLPIWMQEIDYVLPESTEEYTVSIAASLADYFTRRDRNVGMLAYAQSREVIQPDRGERQRNKMLETLAVLRADGEMTIEHALHAEMQVFARGTTLIVITPTASDAWADLARQLKRRGLRVVTVLIDPAGFGGPKSSAPLAAFLEASGVASYLVQNGDNLSGALSRKPTGAARVGV